MKRNLAFARATTAAFAYVIWPVADLAAAEHRVPAFANRIDAYIRNLRASGPVPPGSVVAVVHDGKVVFERAYGVRDVAANAAMTPDTPVYTASVTKAYTGLLAAQLDADGTLPLSASLSDIWPGITLPTPLDPRRITAAALLSHTAGFSAGGLVFRSVSTGQIRASDVPGHLAHHAKPEKPGFEYGNIGPFVWSVMAEARTGVRWNDLLKQRTLVPLGLSKTSARLEDFSPDDVARCHVRRTGTWQPVPHKPTPVLNAAGGLYSSGRDAARFLQAFVSAGTHTSGPIPASVLRRTWHREATQDRQLWGMQRDGYGLGWDLGTYEGHRFVSRSGGYPGCRAIMMFLPAQKLGIAVLSNGDVAANSFNAAIFTQAIDEWLQAPNSAERARQRIADYQATAVKAIAEADALPSNHGAATAPDELLRMAPGVYVDPRLGEFHVSRSGDQLTLTGGVFSARLLPRGGDVFTVMDESGFNPSTLTFERHKSGAIASFMWDDDRYLRVDRAARAKVDWPRR